MTDPTKKSFLREWGLLIAFGVFACVAIGGFRFWTERQADAPVSEAYALYLREVAAQSKGAAAYLEDYYAEHARRTVASQHFESVCGAVTTLADRDGFDPARVSAPMASACRDFAKWGTTGTVP